MFEQTPTHISFGLLTPTWKRNTRGFEIPTTLDFFLFFFFGEMAFLAT